MSLSPNTPPDLDDITAAELPFGSGAPDPDSNHPIPSRPTRRIPNLGHAALFVGFAGILLILSELILTLIGKTPASLENGVIKVQHPILQIATMAGIYLTTLLASWLLFPLLWNRSFFAGLQWNWFVARKQAGQLIALGFVLGLMMSLVTSFITPPKSMPVDEFFLTPATAWIITLFGTVIAPIFEEICFRGFLVPAFAISYDWLALPRTEEARLRWRTTTTLTPVSLIFSAVLSSLCFAMLHAQQVAHIWAALLVLFSISLVLTFVRVKMHSVAASTLVHSAYNSFVFLTVLFQTGGYRHLDRIPH